MNDTIDDLLAARSREPDGLGRMVAWSVAAHIAIVAFYVYMPDAWRGQSDEPARTVMTISLGGAPGPRTGGLTPIGGRTVQAPPPVEPVRRVDTPPAAKPPEMALPSENARPRPRPARAPTEATGRMPTTGAEPQEGPTRTDTGARGQGFGLTSAGGGGTGVQLDVANFCCPEYLEQMITLIQRNWVSKHGVAGTTGMKFTITRGGTIEQVSVEFPSGFVALDLAAQRALLLTRLPELPPQYQFSTLPVHMRFEYSR
jgi:outer membrane biosynthesis protein TonB